MLPAKPTVGRSQKDETSHIKPGTWWRLVDDSHSLAENEAPDHGIVLLLKEVRIVDGEIHTLILASHPLWPATDVRMLFEEFTKVMTPEPNGLELRAAEEAELMKEIQAVTETINSEPSEEALQLLITQEREKRAASNDGEASERTSALVPAALLPSQDIMAAQEKLEAQIVEMNARAAWIQQRTDKVQAKMRTVGRYQSEKVATALSEISDVTNHATNLLKNVQTMHLFLGDEISVEHLVEGKSAAAEEPLTFMQSMLFFDEELFVEAEMLDGFDYSNMGDLGPMLQNNPQFIQRMLPYERCVAITRVRRENTPLPQQRTMSINAFLERLAEEEANARIQILVRDGENIWKIVADETTSKAQRLFPSTQEIDAIFSDRTFHGEVKRVISAQDIEYTDRRAEHDDRALFYKRFLIMFWGLHERLGTFGPFMPQGHNWLEETTHSSFFRFIHDEENVLTNDRPGVATFIKQKNAALKAGSRIVAVWDRLIDEENTPTMYTPGGYNHDPIRKGYPHRYADDSLVFLKDDKLTATCPGTFETSKHDADYNRIVKDRNFYVTLEHYGTRSEGSPETGYKTRLQRHFYDGFLCLDDVSIEELDYYIESRINRRSYLSYLQLFAYARKALIELNHIDDDMLLVTLNEEDRDALKLWKSANKQQMPSKPAQLAAVRDITRALSFNCTTLPAGIDQSDLLEVRVNAKGHIVLLRPARDAVPITKVHVPTVEVEEYKLSKKGQLKLVKTSRRSLTEDRDVYEVILATPDPEALAQIAAEKDRELFRHIKDDKSFTLLEGIEQDACLEGFRELKEQIINPTGDQVKQHLLNLLAINQQTAKGPVRTDPVKVDVGLAISRRYNHDYRPYVISLEMDIITHFHNTGFEGQVEAWLDSICKHPEGWLEALRNRSKKPLAGIEVKLRLLQGAQLHQSFKPAPAYDAQGQSTLRELERLNADGPLLEKAIAECLDPETLHAMAMRPSTEHSQKRLELLEANAADMELLIHPEIRDFCEEVLRSQY